LVQDHLTEWLAEPAGVAAGDGAAMRGLVEGLLISGFAMQAHGNSRPASGSEHQFSHLWEMEGLTVGGAPAAHGACVGIGTIAMLALYEQLLAREMPSTATGASSSPLSLEERLAQVEAAFPPGPVRDSALDEVRAKWASPERLARRLLLLADVWPELRQRLRQKLPTAFTVQSWLDAAGAPASPEAIAISRSKLRLDYSRARLIRRRFTALDLLDDVGCLADQVDLLFTARGFWRANLTAA
jgi:glycerol-1-phosphate dehydrogenase [NAD(P)+]